MTDLLAERSVSSYEYWLSKAGEAIPWPKATFSTHGSHDVVPQGQLWTFRTKVMLFTNVAARLQQAVAAEWWQVACSQDFP